jgi:endonuclease G
MKQILLGGLLITFISLASASTSCPGHYAGGQAPRLIHPNVSKGFVELCAPNHTFATGYSKVLRVPLYSAERVTATNLNTREDRSSVQSFRPDDRLTALDRAELDDYQRSVFDRGHMTSEVNSWSDATEADTYLLSNIVPQAPRNNRGLHAHIENELRQFAKATGEIYIITGPIFDRKEIHYLNDRIAIPTRIYKLVYLPSRNEAAAYLQINSDGPEGQQYTEISLAQLNELTGMSLLPGVKAPGVLKLPKPKGKGVIDE